jgi:hypothetical protein
VEISKKKFGSILSTIAILCILVGYFAAYDLQLRPSSLVVKEKSPVTGYVRVWVKRVSLGEESFVLLTEGENDVMYGGLHLVRDFLGFNNGTITSTWRNDSNICKVDYIGVSNASSAVVQTWTCLPGEMQWYQGFNRTLASTIVGFAGNSTAWNCTVTFTANDTCANLQLAGLYWGGNDVAQFYNQTLFAAKTFTSTTLFAADQLRLEWDVNLQTG